MRRTQYPATKKDAINFLKSFVPPFCTYSMFENNIMKYEGKFKPYLLEIINYAHRVNHGAGRFFGIGPLEIERIVDATFPEVNHSKFS